MKTISLEQSLEIMGEESVIGPEDIKSTFGFTPEDIPDIPFSGDELTQARDLGHHLILYTDSRHGAPFTLEDAIEAVSNKAGDGGRILFNEEHVQHIRGTTSRPCWRLTSPEVIEVTRGRNYLEQTEALITYLQGEVFAGQELPEIYQTAIAEFTAKKEVLLDLMKSDEKEAAQQLSSLTISQLTRENTPEAICRLIIDERKNGVRHLKHTHTWTTSIQSDGLLVRIGRFDWRGLQIHVWDPEKFHGFVGTCFSRSL